jgi:hypothetical protein
MEKKDGDHNGLQIECEIGPTQKAFTTVLIRFMNL